MSFDSHDIRNIHVHEFMLQRRMLHCYIEIDHILFCILERESFMLDN